jgi:hypothetical protein
VFVFKEIRKVIRRAKDTFMILLASMSWRDKVVFINYAEVTV